MGYYFSHVDENGDTVDFYPGSPGFDFLDRGPQLPSVYSPDAGHDAPELPADLQVTPAEISSFDPVSFYDLLLLLQRDEEPPEDAELVGIETFALSPVVSSSGLKGILLDILGPYDTVVTQYKYQQGNNSYYTYVNDISPDYPWIASAALFIALVLSVFSLLKRSMSWMK